MTFGPEGVEKVHPVGPISPKDFRDGTLCLFRVQVHGGNQHGVVNHNNTLEWAMAARLFMEKTLAVLFATQAYEVCLE